MASDIRKIYWADLGTDEIVSSGLSGGPHLVLYDTGAGNPFGVAVDTHQDKLFFTDQTLDYVGKMNRDGSSFEAIASGLFNQPLGIALDRVNQKIYVADLLDSSIYKMDYDGGNFEVFASGADGLNQPVGVAVDEIAQKVYWTDLIDNDIMWANTDGTGKAIIVTGLNDAQAIEVDHDGGKIYWVDDGSNAVAKADLDGQNKVNIVTGLSQPRGVAVDVVNSKVIYTDAGTDDIFKANLDGSSPQVIFASGVPSDFRDVEIDQIPFINANINLFISGPTQIVSSTDLFLKVLENVSGSLDLFVSNFASASGSTDLFIEGVVAFVSGTTDLFISGPIQLSGGIDLYLANSGVIDSWTGFLKGQDNTEETELSLFIYGSTTSGVFFNINTFDLFIQNSGSDVQDPPQFNNNWTAFLRVDSVNPSGYWPAFLRNVGAVNDQIDLFIHAGPNISGTVNLFVKQDPGFTITPGFDPSRNEWSAFLRVLPGNSGGLDLFISGVPTSGTNISGSIDEFIYGHGYISGGLDNYIFGVLGTISGGIDLFIVAETGVQNNRSILYTHGY